MPSPGPARRPAGVQNPAVTQSSLPQLIPPQTAVFGNIEEGKVDRDGKVTGIVTVDVNWYLFLYNLVKQTIGVSSGSTGGGSTVTVMPMDLLALNEIDVGSTDAISDKRAIINASLLEALDTDLAGADLAGLPVRSNNVQLLALDPDVGPSLRDMTNAIVLGSEALLQDPGPQAQPAQTVTVTASPFTYTAPFSGQVSVTAGTVSLISIVRQGVTVGTGLVTGLIPVSRLDQVKITYSVLPTVVFLPT